LAIANELCSQYNSILVIEKEHSFGQHVSSRNSEVIHSGIYYPPGSLKALLCVRGNHLMYDFAKKYHINYKNCGKIVVASKYDEIERLEALMNNGQKNNVEGLKIISASEVSKREPLIRAAGGLTVASTGIIDSHAMMHKLAYLITSGNSDIVYNTEVKQIRHEDDSYSLTFKDMDYVAKSRIVINSTGLWCDKISKMVGIDEYKLHICKGEYYTTSMYRNKLKSLIYPLPTNISLGTHIVLHLDGSIGFGPNAYYVDEIDYNIDNSNKKRFLKHINQYMDLPEDALSEDFAGIRPKIQAPGKPQEDFIIRNETEKGYHNFINLIGIESPGLTSSLAIAEYVKDIID
jgi:L-2-hydroxyglutarate oxidase LhgO